MNFDIAHASISKVETHVNTTSNTGGNSGEENANTGNARAMTSVKTEVNSGSGESQVNIEMEASANGQEEGKKIKKSAPGEKPLEAEETLSVGGSQEKPSKEDEINIFETGIKQSIINFFQNIFRKIRGWF